MENLTKELAKKVNDLTTSTLSQTSDSGAFIKSMSDFTSSLEQKEQHMIKKTIKKGDITNKVSDKKMNLPIGKLYGMKKSETKEATGSGSAGGFLGPLQGEMKEKWSQKYKDSIDCDNPKGFSQRAHCAGKSKKVETKEATSSSSMGAYDAPGFEDVKMKGNNPIGSGRSFKKSQIPGGTFVKVKEKCKKFPYCNQGDINALELTKSAKNKKTLSEIIDESAKKYNVEPKIIRQLIMNEINKKK
jgi:hypothetical protein